MRLITFVSIVFIFTGCFSIRSHFSGSKRTDAVIERKIEKQRLVDAIKEKRLVEGMDKEMVLQIWGEPSSQKSPNEGFLIWEYTDTNLYFIDNILITWKAKKNARSPLETGSF